MINKFKIGKCHCSKTKDLLIYGSVLALGAVDFYIKKNYSESYVAGRNAAPGSGPGRVDIWRQQLKEYFELNAKIDYISAGSIFMVVRELSPESIIQVICDEKIGWIEVEPWMEIKEVKEEEIEEISHE